MNQSISSEVFNIRSVRIHVLEPVPAVTPFQDATMGPFLTFGLAMIIIEDENGIQGEAPVFSSYTNILESCFLPILLHSKNVPYSELYTRLYWSIRNEGFRGAAAAMLGQVDIALHDLAARRAGMPLHRYLGATRDAVKMYGSGGGTNYTLQQLETEMRVFLDAGADCYKMKIGKDFGSRLAEDVERVKFARSFLGPQVKLAVDVNQVWSAEQALRFLDATGAQDIAWLEEPVHSAAVDQIRVLCSQSPVPIAFGESERTSKVFPTLLEMGVRHLQPVPTQIAGVREWMEARDLAASAQVDFSSGGYSLHTAGLMTTAHPDCRVEYLYSIMHGLEQYFSVKPEWKQGTFILPDIPGIPVRIDWEYWNRAGKVIRSAHWNATEVNAYRPNVTL
ncbi:mandelate racemase/muconate lactonizing enzyme family protein [Chitinophaga polysaccharea]|uniref:mandelate racemase/muconate lactonizing enzyme family protein n=1 Tax=Chitinophaga TaxID=79328 RepID=UPI001455A55C|nr:MULTISPECIES: mandelate racemase/muconate lactonizing enzyme family protein [Chitinophaga]NLR62567.1 mandelate racemase/muconate lactonizing enzyme family protein [Chitinophaga polysaccharea]NLU91499.1 mandelate racemase/muconate lactonizing enzyme family protein [Chitinophaga sp. Ak27]